MMSVNHSRRPGIVRILGAAALALFLTVTPAATVDRIKLAPARNRVAAVDVRLIPVPARHIEREDPVSIPTPRGGFGAEVPPQAGFEPGVEP